MPGGLAAAVQGWLWAPPWHLHHPPPQRKPNPQPGSETFPTFSITHLGEDLLVGTWAVCVGNQCGRGKGG